MNIVLSKTAVKWFEDEMFVKKGDFVRFYVKYGGSSPIQQGFSLGVNKEKPIEIGAMVEHHEATYFVEERDIWYFDGHDLHVDYDEKIDEPLYHYVK